MECRRFLLLLLALLPLVASNLIVYPSANGAPKSNKFQIFVTQNGQRHESFVYMSSSQHRTHDASHVRGGRTMSWTSFAFTGAKVTVEVHTPRDFQHCIVRPKHYGINCRHAGSKIAKFDVPSNTKMMSVEFDYDYGSYTGHDITDKLMVFADPPETHKPNKNDNHVLYYDVGVHNLNGQKDIGAKTEVYLAPGAFVKGGFITSQGHGVKIYGRGVLDNRDYKWHDNRFSWATINMDKGHQHTVEGITISDSCFYFIRALSDHNTISNVKMVGAWIYNNDGVSTGDNGVLYADNVHVSRCVVWQAQNGAVFQTGWWTGRDMHNVRVTDVDIIHTDWCTFKGGDMSNCQISNNDAVFDHAGDTKNLDIADIEFRNIRVEGTCPRIINWK
ncbi:hypothetical protein BaRGS_00001276, partial [Batillaria attramentaria]